MASTVLRSFKLSVKRNGIHRGHLIANRGPEVLASTPRQDRGALAEQDLETLSQTGRRTGKAPEAVLALTAFVGVAPKTAQSEKTRTAAKANRPPPIAQ
jgi:hypothetical protein